MAGAEDDELLMALLPNAYEQALLAYVCDDALKDALLFGLLRAPVGDAVPVQVNTRQAESDAFAGAVLTDLIANGEYVDATLTRAVCDADKFSFELRCASLPSMDKTYIGDDVEDKLLQFFAKELIRFPGVQVGRTTEYPRP